jgi:hypothetical protein
MTKHEERFIRVSTMKCRDVRREFALVDQNRRQQSPEALARAVEQHLSECTACAHEYRLYSLSRNVIELSASEKPVSPNTEWFAGLKAAIARQSDAAGTRSLIQDSWTALVWITAKQLIPIMAAVVVIILGASLLWRTNPVSPDRSGIRASDRFVLSGRVYEYPKPTADDVIETLVAVEEKNGK